jgi:hypothetical protein
VRSHVRIAAGGAEHSFITEEANGDFRRTRESVVFDLLSGAFVVFSVLWALVLVLEYQPDWWL